MTKPHMAQDALQLYPYDSSKHQKVKFKTRW